MPPDVVAVAGEVRRGDRHEVVGLVEVQAATGEGLGRRRQGREGELRLDELVDEAAEPVAEGQTAAP